MSDTENPEKSPELAATGACVAALEDLPAEAQQAVLGFLAVRFGNFVRPVEPCRGVTTRGIY